MDDQRENTRNSNDAADESRGTYDYAHVDSVARIALYDDLLSTPRVTEVKPADTAEFIENLASKIYEQAKGSGGTIPYTVIREVAENFIHARFAEATVSILDGGNTIRFADQGPGISQKEKAQLPGFTSAVEPMKRYIRGVGSGLPIVKEYLGFSHGTITIEDNLGTGSVVTISLKHAEERAGGDEALYVAPQQPQQLQPQQLQPLAAPRGYHQEAQVPIGYAQPPMPYPSTLQAGYPAPYPSDGRMPISAFVEAFPAVNPNAQQRLVSSFASPLSQRERDILAVLLDEGPLGVTEMQRITGFPTSSTHGMLGKLEQAGLIRKTYGSKRELTDLGHQVANSL